MSLKFQPVIQTKKRLKTKPTVLSLIEKFLAVTSAMFVQVGQDG
jgi:hypothetical protein